MSTSRPYAKGFTLIELMVSISIFAIVVTLITGAYIQILAASTQAQATTTATDNMAFVMENMTRLVRTGDRYTCSTTVSAMGLDCDNGIAFSFKDIDGNTITYTRVVNGTDAYINEHVIYAKDSSGNSPGPTLDYRVTEANINVSTLSFTVKGSNPTDTFTPRVRIIIQGSVPGANHTTLTFSLETLATMRGIDL